MVMWPLRIDMTRDECRKCLRCLELDAYGSMVSVLRAQGPLTSEKQKLLQELAKVLHISNERHRAEVRRAVNDEKLAVIAEQLNGPNTGIDWAIEGRRTVPLLPRLKARTAFTTLAHSLSLATAVANQKLPLIHEKIENPKGIISEPQEQQILKEKPLKQEECHKQNNVDGLSNHNGEKESYDFQTNLKTLSRCAISEKRKSPSPLPSPPPSKVIKVSPNSSKIPNHSTTFENSTHVLQSLTNTSQHHNVAVIPLGSDCVRPISTATCKDFVLQTSTKMQSQGDKNIASTNENNVAKSRPKIVIPHDKLNVEDLPVVILPSATLHDEGKVPQQCSNLESRIPTTDETSTTITHIPQETVKICRSESDNSNTVNVTRVTPVLNPNVKTIVPAKTLTSSAAHLIKAVHPGNTASSGPGPPHIRPITTTVVRTKIPPTTFNHQSANRMGITLNSNKTVNISHHPNTKLTSKTNVIVIQKGSSKGVTLSHAGKEVLGKVIMGGKNLCVSGQQSTSINLLPHRISANNGDQAVTVSTNANSPFANSLKSNLKSGDTIVFNLRRDTVEGKETFSQIQKSSSTLTSESKSVIQNTSAHFTRKEDDTSHTHDTELPLNTATTVTTVTQESQDR